MYETDTSPTLDARAKDGPRRNQAAPTVFTVSGHGEYSEGVGTLRADGGDCGQGSENLVTGVGVDDVTPTLVARCEARTGNTQDGFVVAVPDVAPCITRNYGKQPDNSEPMTFDWQVGDGGNDQSFRGKSRAYITDKPGGPARSLTANHQLAVHIPDSDTSAGPMLIPETYPCLRAGNEHNNSDPTMEASMLIMDGEPSLYQDSEFGAQEYDTAGSLRAGREPHHQMVFEPHHDEHDGRGVNFKASDQAPTVRGPHGADNPLVIHCPDVASPLMSGANTEAAHNARSGMGKDSTLIAFGHQEDRNFSWGDMVPALTANQGRAIAFSCKDNGADASDEVSPTLRVGGDDGGAVTPAIAFSAGNSGDSYGVGATVEGTPPLRAGASGTNQVPTVAFQLTGDRDDPGVSAYDEVHPTLPANPMSDRQAAIAYQCQGSNVGEMGTLRSGNGDVQSGVPFAFQTSQSGTRESDAHANNGSRRHNGVSNGSAVRRLTPVECERLQGFPDGWTDIPWRGKDHAPDGPRYKALGNSMAVPVMRWLGERVEMVNRLIAEMKA
jgi:DNA (cytosine-5)-methyltransferase 1